MKTLVTGGAGFIGSHLVDRLIREGHEVTVIDDLSFGKEEYINRDAEFIKVDIRDKKIEKILADVRPELVFHLAAQKNVRTSFDDPLLDAEINIMGALNIFHNAKKNGLKKFVFISTAGVYGESEEIPTSEKAKIVLQYPYGLNKYAFEQYLKMLADEDQWSVLRLANVYGPRQDPYGEAGVISIFIDNALQEKKLFVNGDGEQTRDFLFVHDAVDAILRASKENAKGIYNVGTSKQTSLLELVDAIGQITGKEVAYEKRSAIPGEVRVSSLDASRLKNELGWHAEYDLKKGLAETIKWFESL